MPFLERDDTANIQGDATGLELAITSMTGTWSPARRRR